MDRVLTCSIDQSVSPLAWVSRSAFHSDVAPYHSCLDNPDRFQSGVIEIRPKEIGDQNFSSFELLSIKLAGRLFEIL